ncbi:MAG: hypothetical protein RhofKO_13050 [Rhodothermales bacterium]
MLRSFLVIIALVGLVACQSTPQPELTPVQAVTLQGPQADPFGDYWYQGEAEITSYDLEQARYGELHEGEAALIFVTEPLSKTKQVKVDDVNAAGDDAVTVMKLNFTSTFTTGIYPYSMMFSSFTPVQRQQYPRMLKVTATSQEWCGHTFTQLNYRDGGYEGNLYSYFESESDQDLSLGDAQLEDELWSTIRLNPADLPTGSLNVVPGTLAQRLSHAAVQPYRAEATLAPHPNADSLQVYTLVYPDLDRTLAIHFTADFPHIIEAWTDTHRGLTTTATRKERMMLDYWSHNKNADLPLRKELGLR